jgi:C4-type Zn-finger protein
MSHADCGDRINDLIDVRGGFTVVMDDPAGNTYVQVRLILM